MIRPRAAASTYWLGRYLERIDATVRVLEVQIDASVQHRSGLPSAALANSLGIAIPEQLASRDDLVRLLLTDPAVPGSVPFCAAMALADARDVRDLLTSELFEAINATARAIASTARTASTIPWARVLATGRDVHSRVATCFGLCEMTLARDGYWALFGIGSSIERVEMTARILGAWRAHASTEEDWHTLLRSVGSLEIHLRRHGIRGSTPHRVLSDLVGALDNPRAIAFGLNEVARRARLLPRSLVGARVAKTAAELAHELHRTPERIGTRSGEVAALEASRTLHHLIETTIALPSQPPRWQLRDQLASEVTR